MGQLIAEIATKETGNVRFLVGLLALTGLIFAGYGVCLLYDFFLLLFRFIRTRSTATQTVAALVTASISGFILSFGVHLWQSPRWGPEFVGMAILVPPGILGYVVFILQMHRHMLRRHPA